MATLAENAAAVKAAQVAIDAAIVAKGGTTPGGLTNAASAIAAIPTAEDTIGLPDIRKILADNMDGYEYAAIYLIAKRLDSTSLSGAVRYKTSDGSVYTSNATHVWDKTKYIRTAGGFDAKWVICYFDTATPSLPLPDANSIIWIYATDNITFAYRSIRGLSRRAVAYDFNISKNPSGDMHDFCAYSPSLIRPPKFDLSTATNINGLFRDSQSLIISPDIIAPLATGFSQNFAANSLFYSINLIRLPERVDLSSQTYIGKCLYTRDDGDNSCVQNLPKYFVANVSVDFVFITSVSRDELAIFDENGNIDMTKAFIGGLSVCGNNDQTFTFASALKNQFTADEQTKIGEAFAAKNWTLVW